MRRKFNSEEERKEAKREAQRKYKEKHLEKVRESALKYAHSEKGILKRKEYESTNADKLALMKKKYYENHKDSIDEYKHNWYIQNKDRLSDEMKEYDKYWRATKKGRASKLVGSYKNCDNNKGRGKCTLTSNWIVEHIFSSSCVYCGETDWHKLGCDRIDNSKPHTQDNVVCSCWDCNNERCTMSFEEFCKKKGVSFP